MKAVFCYILLLCFCVSFGFSQNSSSVNFVIKNIGINVDGDFKTFTINTDFDTNGTLNSVAGKITVASIVTGIDSRDEHLLEEDYFDSENHKFITLQSTSISKKGDTSYTVKADLSIKGITKAVNVTVNVVKTNGNYKITSKFEIDRKNFKVGGSSFVMSNTVKIKVIHYQKL